MDNQILAFLDHVLPCYPAGVSKGLVAARLAKLRESFAPAPRLWLLRAVAADPAARQQEDELLKAIVERGLRLRLSEVKVVDLAPGYNPAETMSGMGAVSLIFGAKLASDLLGDEFQPGQVQTSSARRCLVANELGELLNDPALKKPFWSQLQEFFGLREK